LFYEILSGQAFYKPSLSKVLPVKDFKVLLFKQTGNDVLQAKIDSDEIKKITIKHAILIF